MTLKSPKHTKISRRNFLRSCAAGTAVLATGSLWALGPNAATKGPARLTFALDQDWLFAGKAGSATAETAFTKVTLPHCVSNLSWESWDADSWQDIWLYRRHLSTPRDFANRRVFVKFDGVMVTADVSINGTPLPTHKGGYLPFTRELTHLLKPGDNILDVKVDARWQPVPPAGSPKGTRQVDYFLPGGIIRGATIYAVPQVFISDVFAKPVDVLKPTRRLDVACSIDAASASPGPFHLEVKLMDGPRIVASARKNLTIAQAGKTDVVLTLSTLKDIKLWDTETPHLYNVVTTLFTGSEPLHDHHTRIGFRDAAFTVDGFFLNGKRLRFFGLNRHELFPYTGYAMPPRVMRRDAEIIRNEFNCDIVRCSHYPQTEAFLDACDELGLMVWQEPPGWQYIGDATFQDLVVQNVGDMIVRDRNHPAIVIWGVRVNESADNQPLYRRTTALAKSLDDSRPTSGSMTHTAKWQTDWHEDVFALDDYHQSPDGTVQILEPLPGIPYMLAETVGQRTYTEKGFGNVYRRAADVALQYKQALYHAQAHDRARAWPRMSGVIAWCAFEYGSPNNSHKGVKNPGVADVFRIPKLGASFYQAQVHPSVRPIIVPNFYWDFGPAAPHGPGKEAIIFSNCDRLELFIDGKHHATLQPDRKGYPNLLYPPFFTALELDDTTHPELRIDGYVGSHLALSRFFSSDPTKDQFVLHADDAAIAGDGIDATRVAFQVTDKYGAQRLLGSGNVTFELTGPGVLVGDNPFSLTESGGAGAVWIKSQPNSFAKVLTLKATHSTLGTKSVQIQTQPNTHVERI
ncbi:MAG TPA: glycoside hydrolase family 2 TIM barrel-domain containing protein [Acidobacteriaceae bacterium]